MEDTLLIGDHVFVDRLTPMSKASYIGPLLPYRKIKDGDIIVFLSPSEPGLHVVKRIIGIPGDRIHLRHGVVYRNGQPLNEPYVKLIRHDYDPYRDDFPSVSPMQAAGQVAFDWPIIMKDNIQGEDLVVPADRYFGMGDDRELSLDSRYWGFIPQENVIGRPLFIYWSFETPEDQYQRTSMKERLQFVFHVAIHFFDKTQWRRMFHLVR